MLCIVDFPKRFFEVYREHYNSKDNGERVRDGLGGVHRKRLVCNDERHDVDKRQQERKFSHNCDDYRAHGIADGHEGHLAGYLYAENEHCAAVYPESARCEPDKSGIGGEHPREKLRE